MNENDQLKTMSRWMIALAWLFVLGLLTLYFSDMLEKQRNPNRIVNTRAHSDGTREVILQRNRSGHYLATGELNGQPVNFLLDTGATWVSIPEKIATHLKLVRGAPMEVSTANGVITAYATWVDTVSLGNIQLHNIRASINPNAPDDDVLLGMSFLKELEMVQRGDILTLRQ
jgi:aspartyl protease family protein